MSGGAVRRPDLDAAKGWGMLLVVLGHASPPDWAQVLIYGFHMPLFFMISGLLWKGVVRPLALARSLMWPFLWASLGSYLLWLAKVSLFKGDGVPWWGPLAATVWGGDIRGFLVHNGALWFLPALFSFYLVAWGLRRTLPTPNATLLMLAALGLSVLLAGPTMSSLSSLPLSAGQGLVGGLFFIGGHLIATRRAGLLTRPPAWVWLALLAVLVSLEMLNGRVDLFSLQFGNPVLYVVTGLLGALLMLQICRVPAAQWRPMLVIGRQSLLVLVLHQPLMWIYKFGLLKAGVGVGSVGLTVLALVSFWLLFVWLEGRDPAAGESRVQPLKGDRS